jgi:DNA-binding MarR family transcriptional regulator
MLVLWEHESVALGALCARLQLDTGTLSPLLKRLEAEGLLERHRRAEDERTVQLTITEQGRELRGKAAAIQARVQETTGRTPAELAALRDDLHALAARLRAAHLVPEPV